MAYAIVILQSAQTFIFLEFWWHLHVFKSLNNHISYLADGPKWQVQDAAKNMVVPNLFCHPYESDDVENLSAEKLLEHMMVHDEILKVNVLIKKMRIPKYIVCMNTSYSGLWTINFFSTRWPQDLPPFSPSYAKVDEGM